MHSHEYVHADIKASNLLLGYGKGEENDVSKHRDIVIINVILSLWQTLAISVGYYYYYFFKGE